MPSRGFSSCTLVFFQFVKRDAAEAVQLPQDTLSLVTGYGT